MGVPRRKANNGWRHWWWTSWWLFSLGTHRTSGCTDITPPFYWLGWVQWPHGLTPKITFHNLSTTHSNLAWEIMCCKFPQSLGRDVLSPTLRRMPSEWVGVWSGSRIFGYRTLSCIMSLYRCWICSLIPMTGSWLSGRCHWYESIFINCMHHFSEL